MEGRRTRRVFKTKAEAEGFPVSQLQIKAENLGARARHINPKLHVMAIEATDILAPHGKTIIDAAEFYRKHLESVERSCTGGRIDRIAVAAKGIGWEKICGRGLHI